jgi:hypothetical protein
MSSGPPTLHNKNTVSPTLHKRPTANGVAAACRSNNLGRATSGLPPMSGGPPTLHKEADRQPPPMSVPPTFR